MVYDVVSDRRRNRLHRLLCEYGVPIQKSAFEARLSPAERKVLLRQVASVVDPAVDSFILYGVTHDQEERISVIGQPRKVVEVQRFFII
jgi:CRISPR-associated protein Cas2